jgi:hypothetical protein
MMRTLALLVPLVACGGTDEPPLTDATSLSCPDPGDLPFRLMSHGFRHSVNENLAKMDTRIKHEGADTLGVTGGASANTHLPDEAAPPTTAPTWDGTMGVTVESGGLFSKPMTDEYVSVWTYDGTAWQMLGRGLTDDDGVFTIEGATVPNGQPAYAMLEANGTCAVAYDYALPAGEKVIVSDIDGTLTTNDNELLMQISDPTHDPAMMGHADQLLQTWAMKGYPIVYLTNRPHPLRVESRTWLDEKMFPTGPVITSNGTASDAAAYKTVWLERMIQTFGWDVVAAYGNAGTDITAYANAGIPKEQTFIVGPLAGSDGTQPIDNMDYADHIQTYVDAQPDNN